MAGKQLFDNSNHAILEREEGSVGLSQSENLWEKVTKRPEKTSVSEARKLSQN